MTNWLLRRRRYRLAQKFCYRVWSYLGPEFDCPIYQWFYREDGAFLLVHLGIYVRRRSDRAEAAWLLRNFRYRKGADRALAQNFLDHFAALPPERIPISLT